jgi:hypothetical protein
VTYGVGSTRPSAGRVGALREEIDMADDELRGSTEERLAEPEGSLAVVRRLMTVHGNLRLGEVDPQGHLVDLSAVEAEDEAALAEPEPAPPVAAARPSTWQSFRAWWRQESAARAEERRAREAAAAAMKTREIQAVQRPAAVVEQTQQAIRGMLELNEERFQSLGLRSDRLHDELLGISTAIAGLQDLVTSGEAPRRVVGPAADAVGDLGERFDALVAAISDELRTRGEETEKRISEQLIVHNAEMAALLEDAVMRIRAAIPEEMDKTRLLIAEAVERAAAFPEPAAAAPEPQAVWAEPPAAPILEPESTEPAFDQAALEGKIAEVLVAMNRNTDRLADALHRGLFHLEQELGRRQPSEATGPSEGDGT